MGKVTGSIYIYVQYILRLVFLDFSPFPLTFFVLSILTKLFLHFSCSLTLTLSPSPWAVLSLAHGSCLSKAMA